MKKMKRILGLLISAIMILSGITAVSAAEESTTTYSITIDNKTPGHTYEAYQIFRGRDVQGKILTDIQWGENVSSEALLKELNGQTGFGNCKTAAEVADALSKKDAEDAKEFAKIAANHLTEPAKGSANTPGASGYVISNLPAGYYLVKDKDNSLPDAHDAYTDFILQIVENKTVAPKSSVPTVEKKVKENSNETWQDGADYNIGDDVPFKLTGTLPEHLTSYTTYKYTFHDKMSAGLTFNKDSVKVKVLNDTTETPVTTGYTVKTEGLADGCAFEVQFDNLRTVPGVTPTSKIIVEYTAKLNDKAVIAGIGNPNEVYLTFSNNPNGAGIGKTPEDKVTVFTFELVVNKKGEDGTNPLKGAAFELMKKVKDQPEEWKSVKKYDAGETTKFEFKGLDSGEYKLVEVTAPAGYNKIEDILFKVEATYEKDSVDPQLTGIVIKDSQDAVISGDGKSFKVNLKPNTDNGNIVTDVINKKGTTLPETGGMGTTIFYVLGGILVLGAAIAFFIKKRA